MKPIAVFVIFLFCAASVAFAQPTGDLTLARLKYSGGGDWYGDPTSLTNLLTQLRERFAMKTALEETVIAPGASDIFSYPIVYMTGHGTVRFSDAERANLREYLRRGGFLWADDNYGLDESFREEMAKLFPDASLTPLPHDHPVFHSCYPFENGPPKIHEHDGKPPQVLGIYSEGRLVVMYSYETDIGDGIESKGVHPQDSPQVRDEAMNMALNIILYALSN
ncbi:MAG: DUF4159 domain-containing protein [Candidatus Hinthialibacter antarcticus]|nr:DUF4159 domain-containing protein [Candidatus Hinthialibacter antarcticus]